ncbi:MAG TPA: relaxase/mobilization nuclease domain-containing protein [Puia sp.]|nr:relaxase/mobilization nuclease domain-containing protein [Puia sp.]
MYALFKMCGGTKSLIDYNEEKLDDEKIQCIYAGNFIVDGTVLSPAEKQQHFDERTALNQRTYVTGVSIILEFAPGKVLTPDDLTDIAVDFLQGIGFARQPHLIYLHEDTACQHLHVVTTNIRHDGSRIPRRNIIQRLIQPVQWQINSKYGLDTPEAAVLKPHDPRQKIRYGKTYTRQAMADTLQYVMESYHYGSLDAFNAILRLYNLRAYAGNPGSWLRRHRGLLYQVTDDDGKPLNAPTKASKFAFKPTLDNLERRFAAFEPADAARVRRMVDEAIRNRPPAVDQWTNALRGGRVAAVPFWDRKGGLSQVFFVDLATKWVFSPAELGPRYEAAAIRESLGFDPFVQSTQEQQRGKNKAIDNVPVIAGQTQPKRGRHL